MSSFALGKPACQCNPIVGVEYGGVRVQGMCPHEFYLGTCHPFSAPHKNLQDSSQRYLIDKDPRTTHLAGNLASS